jgi:hypothetical protein
MLDGWAHHIGTAGFALAFLWKEKEVVFCIGLVVESSSIVLCLSRVLYDVEWVRVLRDRCFGTLFLVSRIVLPTLGMVYFYPQSMDPVCATMHMLGTTLHCHWFCHFQQKKKLKP